LVQVLRPSIDSPPDTVIPPIPFPPPNHDIVVHTALIGRADGKGCATDPFELGCYILVCQVHANTLDQKREVSNPTMLLGGKESSMNSVGAGGDRDQRGQAATMGFPGARECSRWPRLR
jgi:hypothetical protein